MGNAKNKLLANVRKKNLPYNKTKLIYDEKRINGFDKKIIGWKNAEKKLLYDEMGFMRPRKINLRALLRQVRE